MDTMRCFAMSVPCEAGARFGTAGERSETGKERKMAKGAKNHENLDELGMCIKILYIYMHICNVVASVSNSASLRNRQAQL